MPAKEPRAGPGSHPGRPTQGLLAASAQGPRTRNLTFNDEQFHVLEKIKVAETGKILKMSLEHEVSPSVTQLSDMLADWYKMAQTVYLQARILDKDVDTFERRLEAFVARVVDNDHSFHDELVNVSRVKGAGRIRGQELKSFFRTSIKDILSGQDEISTVISENTDLIRQFNNMAKGLGEEKSEPEK
ncbi:hypothetical protein LSTR_LSTR000632 [Laodelphax striatellus]|uniref:TANK-binding kinase 1 coiled-coil domain-containing protein n=1 Tax=Laodelphax striatellus TaxID=195883 RepID=A0A482XGL1_LAOST|nr:hypothetical protein LSTR_LSTR000632 [Laodelphax striatellus]